MVRAGSTIDIYVLRNKYVLSEKNDFIDCLFRSSSFENAIIAGVRKSLELKLKSFDILDKNHLVIFSADLY